MKKVILVGYGNILRGDDGLGPLVAESFEGAKGPPGTSLHVLSLPQLDVALVAHLQDAQMAVFVDARQDDAEELLLVDSIAPLPDRPARSIGGTHSTHSVEIPALLTLAAKWYGRAPLCYLVQPKGFDFSLGAHPSERGRQAAKQARQAIQKLLREL